MPGQLLKGRALLVADDDVDGAELLEMILESSGATVQIANTAGAALDALKTFTADLLLLDVTLPDMDGYELLREARRTTSAPAIAVTGHARERDRARAIAAGFAVHVAKPIDHEALVSTIARLLAAPPAAGRSPALQALDTMLGQTGLLDVLRALNARTSYRYTALYRFDGPTLRSVALIDRCNAATVKGGDVPIETSFCSLLQRDRQSFAVREASADPRIVGLPLQEDVRAYCGALVRNADGTPFGSLCHFDHVARDVPEEELELLEQLAPILAGVVANDGLSE